MLKAMALPEVHERPAADQRHRFTVAEYFALAEQGLLPERCELIEGDIYDVSAHSPRHRAVVDTLLDNFKSAFRGRATVFGQSTLAFEGWSPEPDVMILKYDPDRYRDRQPNPEEIYLIVEVADTTLAKDKGLKLRNYAREGIREYWVVNLPDEVIEVYREPRGGPSAAKTIAEYAFKSTHSFDEAVAPLAFPDERRRWLEPNSPLR
jgi:Uma2 family endonuclease